MTAEIRARLGEELEHLSQRLVDQVSADFLESGRDGLRHPTDLVHRVIQRRIRLLGQLVAGLSRVDEEMIVRDGAGYGSVIRVRDHGTGAETSYALMAGDFIDLDAGQVSLDSPVGRALLGCRAGDEVSVATPAGVRRLAVLSVLTLPQRLDLPGSGERSAPSPAAASV